MVESDPDSISLTSSVDSDHDQFEQYNVARILADHKPEHGERLYLVDWEGYPLTRTTWEPKESFLQELSLLEVGDNLLFSQEAQRERPPR